MLYIERPQSLWDVMFCSGTSCLPVKYIPCSLRKDTGRHWATLLLAVTKGEKKPNKHFL